MAIYGDADSLNNETNLVTPATVLKFNPIVEVKLIQKNKYKIEMVEWFDGNHQDEIDSMVIYPIELGFFVEFKNNKDRDFAGKGFRQQTFWR